MDLRSHFFSNYFIIIFTFKGRRAFFGPIKEASLLLCNDGKTGRITPQRLIGNYSFGFHGFQLSALYGVWRRFVLLSVCC